MANEEELKWLTKRYMWRYVPFRYQSMVAVIAAGLLCFNILNAYSSPNTASSGECGSLFRPVITRELSAEQKAINAAREATGGDARYAETAVVGFPWESVSSIFTLNQELNCPRKMQALWWEMFFSFGGLAICGVFMRRAIGREADAQAS